MITEYWYHDLPEGRQPPHLPEAEKEHGKAIRVRVGRWALTIGLTRSISKEGVEGNE